MVIDTSAVIGLLQAEAETPAFKTAIERDPVILIGAATLFEASMILLSRRGDKGLADLDDLLRDLSVDVVPLDRSQSELAVDAFRRFGKGRHRASLNFGDCFTYALAKSTGQPLLFKGNDFIHTDLTFAV